MNYYISSFGDLYSIDIAIESNELVEITEEEYQTQLSFLADKREEPKRG